MFFRRVDGTDRRQYYSHKHWDTNPQPSWTPRTNKNYENKSLLQKISQFVLPKPSYDVITNSPAGLKQSLWDENSSNTNTVRPVKAARGYEQNIERPILSKEEYVRASDNRAFNNIQEVGKLFFMKLF